MSLNQETHLKKETIRTIFFALVGTCFLLMIGLLFSFSNQVYADELAPGEVRLTKTAKPVADMINQWDVTVRVDGRNHFPPPSTDIVLVIDMSNSMVTGSKDRLTLAKEAAKKFVKQVLKDDYNNKISLVTYETDVTIHKINNKEFVDSTDRTSLLKEIDSLSIDPNISNKGGTFTQGAIREATNQLQKSSAHNRDIVLISDGVPTYNYDIKTPYNQKDHMERLLDKEPIAYDYYSTKKGIPENYYDYSTVIGAGMSYLSKAPDSWGIPTGNDRIRTNSAYAAIDEAGFTKARKYGSTSEPLVTDFYAIGIDLKEEKDDFEIVGQQTLKEIASSEDTYFDTSSDDLDDVLSGIGNQIIGAIKSGTIVDPMGTGFKLTDKNKIDTTQGNIAIKTVNGVETIDWDFAALLTPISTKDDESVMYAEMTYRVDATDDVIQAMDTDGFAPTNGKTTIKYISYDKQNDFKEKIVESEFVVPKVNPTIVSLEKKVIDGKGNEIKTKDEKFKFSYGNDSYTGNDSFELYATDKQQTVHPWKANQNYSVEETLTGKQEYMTTIDINKQETQGSSATFMFTYDSSSNSYPHQEIVVTNQNLTKILHVRQTVIEASEELVIPKKGYYTAINEDSQKMNLISGSTTKNTAAEINKSLFTVYKIELEKKQTIVSLSDVIPEYYQFYGYTLTNSSDNLATRHISSNTDELKKDPTVLLDYKTEDEYWLTIFIKPQFNSSETSPRPYSWNYKTNQFGK